MKSLKAIATQLWALHRRAVIVVSLVGWTLLIGLIYFATKPGGHGLAAALKGSEAKVLQIGALPVT